MVTIVTEEGGYADIRGLSTDEKPVDKKTPHTRDFSHELGGL